MQGVSTPMEQLKNDNRLLNAQLEQLGTDKSRADMARELATSKMVGGTRLEERAGAAPADVCELDRKEGVRAGRWRLYGHSKSVRTAFH